MLIEFKEQEAINFLTKLKKKTCVCYSGGKDSLVALDLAIKSGISDVVFCDTTVELQETLDNVEEIEHFYNIKITRVSAPRPFFDLVYDMGFPTRALRWCCKVYKFSPFEEYARRTGIRAYITGLRKEENSKRKSYKMDDKNHFFTSNQINPILNWSEDEIYSYIHKYNLPINPLYKLGFKRVGCWPCPFKSREEWKLIEKNFPEKYDLLQKTLQHILKDCEGIGIRDLSDFITNFKWAGYMRPQNTELKGKIEVSPEVTMIHLKNIKQLERVKNVISILSKDYKVIGNSIIIRKKLRRQSVKILTEKAINCVGCGACVALCDSIRLGETGLIVDEETCISCFRCIKTDKIKGACIKRNFSPFRYAVGTCQDKLIETNDIPINPDSRIGLIRTRKKLEIIEEKFKKVAGIKKNNDYLIINNKNFNAFAYKSKGLVEIKLWPKNGRLEKAMNCYRKVMA